MRILLRIAAGLGLAFALSACASVNLDPGGPNPVMVRHARIVEAQNAYGRAEADCLAAARFNLGDGACARRDELAAQLRRQGYCRHTADLGAAVEAARYDLWTACGATWPSGSGYARGAGAGSPAGR